MQTQHTGSLADRPMTLAHTLQLSSVLTELKAQKNGLFGHLEFAETREVCTKVMKSINVFFCKQLWSRKDPTGSQIWEIDKCLSAC